MDRRLTYGKKIALGFAVILALSALISVIAYVALRNVTMAKDRIIHKDAQILTQTEKLRFFATNKAVNARGFLLTRDQDELRQMRETRNEFLSVYAGLRESISDPASQALLQRVGQAEQDYQQVWERILREQSDTSDRSRIVASFKTDLMPRLEQLENALKTFQANRAAKMREAIQESSSRARSSSNLAIGLAVFGVIAGAALAWLLTKSLTRQIGSAVQHVQSSSSELQAAANEQATGAREQASAVNEIATTIKELLATSRQISESAQRVAKIAEDTMTSAQYGDQTVARGQEAISTIKHQTDQVVNQVLDLGRRSQQIGGVVDIITELAEQTNILAINAAIEAAGAGESGKRFSVVADEIRKLSDRVGGSAKDIRALIEEIRSSVNTTVMATESGAKAVETGTRQFREIAGSFQKIVSAIGNAAEAVREIELSTKQQTTAVEQVNTAISSVAQAIHELEANSTQTLQTSSQLATLSKELNRMVQTERSAA